ncbi:cholesterol 24-hydroxylase-like [Orbicella faveolata]|uniref:cholesterol 24-hydroxylase-like n=1 Tax=Orbicella faveolata TaxID=48498 RepID=UPI0009E20549|nr:cholesterol 24-hydroxylase-like [Orbicella faveolata]
MYADASYIYGQRFLGDGISLTADVKSWQKRRDAFGPAFHRKCLKEYMSSFNSTANILLEHLGTMADGKTKVCMYDQLYQAALDVICKVGFGMDMDIISGKNTEFTEAISLTLVGIHVAIFEQPFHKWNVFQYPFQRRVIKAVQFLRETGRKVIEERKNAMNEGEEVPDDILQHIIEQQEADPNLGIEDMLDDFLTFFIAAHETTASLMSFCLLEIGGHPEIMESLVGEVFDVLGDKQNVAFDDLAKLYQLGLAMKETLRLYPPVAATLRTSGTGQDIGGYKIPANTNLMVSSFVNSHSPEFWTNPEEFNPYRFDNEELVRRSCYTTFPFSLGPRNCIGKKFAQIEAKILLSRFLQTFKFSLVPGQSGEVIERLTIRPKDGVMCTLTKRL